MAKKIGRNDPCPCGSGKKYKKCCISKESDDKKIPLEKIFSIAKTHLNTLESAVDSTKKMNIKNIELMNGILVVTHYSNSTDSISNKIEACKIIAYLSGLFDGETKIGELQITHFATKNLDKAENEIMYAISSKESARFARNGQSVEWLTHTLFQDNTDEHRLSQAKIRISRVENGLRRIISIILSNRDGEEWWNNIDNGIKGSAERVYAAKFGNTSLPNGNQLIEYTYLPNLKIIILNNWNYFEHIFKDSNIFSQDMDRLNIIRREEGHNRIISPSLIIELEDIYNRLLGFIEHEVPGTIPHFLVENWRIELAKIFDDLCNNMVDITEDDRKNPEIVAQKFKIFRDLTSDVKCKLEGLTVPPDKKELHSELLDIISRSVVALDRMIKASKINDLKEVMNANTEQEKCMNELNDFREKYLLSEI